MPRRLVAINVVLAAVSVLCIGLVVKQIAAGRPAVPPRGRSPIAAPAEPAPAGDSRQAPQAYNVIATRNMFSPTRSETAGPAVAGNAPALVAKPSLHGVVLREGSPIAYLEDPLTKRIAGYRIGDPIAGGTVQTISADAVVIARPDGVVDVRLRDPSKPRPPAPRPASSPFRASCRSRASRQYRVSSRCPAASSPRRRSRCRAFSDRRPACSRQ